MAITSSVGRIAAGAVGTAANFIEQTMAGGLSLVIGFLAKFIGLGGIGERIRGIIHKVQQPVNRGIEKVVEFVVGKVGGLVTKIRDKKDKDTRTHEQKKADLKGAVKEANRILDEKDASVDSINCLK